MPWGTLKPPDSVELALSRGGRGFEVGCCGWLVGRLTVRRSLLMSVGCVMVESRCSVLFVGMVVGGPGAPQCRQPVGRRSRCDLCTPDRLDVGRLACGLFTVKSVLQLRSGWCVVVLAASWLAWFAWVLSRCRRWLGRRMLFV